MSMSSAYADLLRLCAQLAGPLYPEAIAVNWADAPAVRAQMPVTPWGIAGPYIFVSHEVPRGSAWAGTKRAIQERLGEIAAMEESFDLFYGYWLSTQQ